MLKIIIHDILCANHSNIPKCCTLFFITFWARMDLKKDAKIMHAYNDLLNSIEKDRPRYIMCPVCIFRKRIPNKINKCKCNDKYDVASKNNSLKEPDKVWNTKWHNVDWKDIIKTYK